MFWFAYFKERIAQKSFFGCESKNFEITYNFEYINLTFISIWNIYNQPLKYENN